MIELVFLLINFTVSNTLLTLCSAGFVELVSFLFALFHSNTDAVLSERGTFHMKLCENIILYSRASFKDQSVILTNEKFETTCVIRYS